MFSSILSKQSAILNSGSLNLNFGVFKALISTNSLHTRNVEEYIAKFLLIPNPKCVRNRKKKVVHPMLIPKTSNIDNDESDYSCSSMNLTWILKPCYRKDKREMWSGLHFHTY